MKTKLFTALKQDHKNLGLSDEVLQAYAESLASTGLVTDENLATVSKGQESALKAFQKNLDRERTERVKKERELEDANKLINEGGVTRKNETEKEPEWFTAYKKEQEEKISKLEKENNEARTLESKAKRNTLILEKAKALKISQDRIDEGFAISDDMDESGIDAYLAMVAKNNVAKALPSENEGLGFSTSDKVMEEISAGFVGTLPDVKQN